MEIPLEGDWLELLLLKLENAAVVTKKKKKQTGAHFYVIDEEYKTAGAP